MNRKERRSLQRVMKKQAEAWPQHLVEVPESVWPSPPGVTRPLAVWRSRHYLVQVYAEDDLGSATQRRLTVNRVTLEASGGWDQNIPWEELQRCKRETGHGDWYGVEVYPRDRDVVNDANMRHLWLLSEPLRIGWFL